MSNGDSLLSIAESIAALKERIAALETEQRTGAYLMSDGVVASEADFRIFEDGATMGMRRDAFLQTYADNVEHFDNGAPTGFAFASAPFSAGNLTFDYSHCYIQAVTVGSRMFYYTPITANAMMGIFSLATNSNGDYVGLRIDDGTDNNYLEYVLVQNGGNGGNWQTHMRSRVGGGGVADTIQRTYATPAPVYLRFFISGIQWTNWRARGLTYAHNALGAMWDGSVINQTWTPSRFGIVARLSQTWQRAFTDALFWTVA